MRRLLRLLSLVTFGYVLGNYTADVLAQQHAVTLHGRIFSMAHPDYCAFFLDPEGESEGVQVLAFSQGSYICDFLKGSEASKFVITLEPIYR